MQQHSGYAALTRARGILFGADYNPEQWTPDVWREDIDLMRRARVNVATVGVFSWARLEPREGERDFAWLDEVLDLLHDGGIAVDLATPTASPPPWLGVTYPETLPVDRDGVRLVAGSRNQFAPTSAVYRERARAITADLVERYATHPAVQMWHVGNEFGQLDFGDEAARAFRDWLRARYESVAALNEAWGTAVWSQLYGDFDEIVPPRRMPYLVNPAQNLDFRRFTSDAVLECYRDLRDTIRAGGATQPITTNFMGLFEHVDYRSWAADVDVIADDQYPDHAAPTCAADTALVQDLMRSLGGGQPWLLMEQAVSATSWRDHNLPKTPAQARLDSLQAVARGADGICFFQWRQSRFGAERFHSALVPHAGPDTEVFEGVCRQGEDLQKLAPLVGSRVEEPVAVIFDWPSWWAASEPARPTVGIDSVAQLKSWYRALHARGLSAAVVGSDADLTGYQAVLVPHGYILDEAAVANLESAARAGARVVIGPFSSVADTNGTVLTGRSPALLRHLIGASGEEWVGLPSAGAKVTTASGWNVPGEHYAHTFAEKLRADGADVLVAFAAGPWDGRPVVTRRACGAGEFWYVAAMVDDALLDAVIGAGVDGIGAPVTALPEGVEAVRRGDALFLLNHTDSDVAVELRAPAQDLLTGERCAGHVTVAAQDARVLMEGLNS
ncbi:beta-galactosidase [Demequina sp.]|uniref:beta-galactosidase n=1 Tax=Demequina sp. TaxID=2050685 RepID=UPI003D106B4F